VRGYLVSAEANTDIFEICGWIAKDTVELADRVEAELYDIFEGLARMPGQGHQRKTSRKDRCYSFLSIPT
jgi:plasmid stabilization system protein ParE